MIRQTALIFDMDDTLYRRTDPFDLAYKEQFGEYPSSVSGSLYPVFRHHGNEVFEASMDGSMSMRDMYIYRIRETMKDIGVSIDDETALAFQERYSWHQKHIQLAPGLEDLFRELSGDPQVFLGVITNGTSAHQREKYQALGMDRFISEEHFLASGDIGINKPDPEILQIAQHRWDLDPSRTWYIGDSYEHDMVCAAAAGWQGIWLMREESSADRLTASSEENDSIEGKKRQGTVPCLLAHSEQELITQIHQLLT